MLPLFATLKVDSTWVTFSGKESTQPRPSVARGRNSQPIGFSGRHVAPWLVSKDHGLLQVITRQGLDTLSLESHCSPDSPLNSGGVRCCNAATTQSETYGPLGLWLRKPRRLFDRRPIASQRRPPFISLPGTICVIFEPHRRHASSVFSGLRRRPEKVKTLCSIASIVSG